MDASSHESVPGSKRWMNSHRPVYFPALPPASQRGSCLSPTAEHAERVDWRPDHAAAPRGDHRLRSNADRRLEWVVGRQDRLRRLNIDASKSLPRAVRARALDAPVAKTSTVVDFEKTSEDGKSGARERFCRSSRAWRPTRLILLS